MSRCLGCGVLLQSVDKDKDGYVDDINKKICYRCFLIKNYGKNMAINKTNNDYLNILDKITDNDIVVYVSSILTLNLDYLNKFKNVILVLTKRDVLPKSVKDNKIINYVKSKYNILDVLIVSSLKKYNLDLLYNKLNKINNNHKIYFVGITNSGKSSLINEMIKSYNGVDGDITISNYPSTTLDIVNKKIGKLNIIDTPGIVIDNSIINYLDNKHIKKINSKKEIKPITFQISGNGAILVDDLFRIEYTTNNSSMTCYFSNSIDISKISLKNPRLSDCEYVEYNIDNDNDLVIEDIGFIKFTNECKIKIYCNNKVYMYKRDNMI